MSDLIYEKISDDSAKLVSFKGEATVIEIPAIVNGYYVTEIGNYVFEEHEELISVTIPESVSKIGQSFLLCKNLETVIFPEYLESIDKDAFSYCTSLKEIHLPEYLESIGSGAFSHCYQLLDVTIPASVKEIGDGVFANCINLQNINVDENNEYFTSVDGVLYSKDMKRLYCYPMNKMPSLFEVPETVEIIEPYAFTNSYLQTIKLPSHLKTISRESFINCLNIISLTIPNEVETIEKYAFHNCIGLKYLTFSSSLKVIGDSAFQLCKNLEHVDLPNTVTTLGRDAFEGCENLKTIHLSDHIETIRESSFACCTNLQSVELPKKLIRIEAKAFLRCSSITTIFIPQYVNKIETSSFMNCTSLKEIHVHPDNKYFVSIDNVLYNKNQTILYCYPNSKVDTTYIMPNTVKEVSSYGISFNPYLEKIVLSDNIINIPDRFIFGSNNIKEVTISKSVEHIHSLAFRNSRNDLLFNVYDDSYALEFVQKYHFSYQIIC
ncbi:MAG: leucine-rich repeat domain-containing protein [Erysipelotrichaceae bacterium]|nr:leucine-rich repeat domain-containing protein [Erysipelotrichaceae bacterium]